MDDKAFKQHYDRVKRQMEDEKLLTFEDLLHATMITPEDLKRTITVLARRSCLYKKAKGEPEEDEDDVWTLQDLRDLLEEGEQGETKEGQKEQHNEDKENDDQEWENISFDENVEPDGGKILSFEHLVCITGCHPFYVERSLVHLALQAENE